MRKAMTETVNTSEVNSSRVYLPIRRLEMALNRIIDIEIPFHLKNLEQHKLHIQLYKEREEWNQLFREQINATQTIQQLKSDIRKMENLTQEVSESEKHILRDRIIPIKSKISSSVEQFIELHKVVSNPLFHLSSDNEQNFCDNESDNSNEASDRLNTNLQLKSDIQCQKFCSETSLFSWQHLKNELNDLNVMINTFATTVMGQKEIVNKIEDNICNSNENVLKGTQHLSKAALLSTFAPAVTAGLVGGAIFGPIGMLAGFKFSGLASGVGASIIAFSGAKIIQKKIINDRDLEMESITQDTNKENSNTKITQQNKER